MKNLKNDKGITLVALVITIILLLILAGVTLNIALNGGLIEKSQVAADEYSEEQAKEKLQLEILEYKMKLITKEYGEEIKLNDHLSSIEGITVDSNTNKISIGRHKFTVNTDTWEIKGKNEVEEQIPDIPETPVIPDEPQVPEVIGKDNTHGTEHTKIGSGDYSYNNPVIPAGFKTVETTLASWADEDNDGIVDGWNEGLVIQDASGNEFVWVPVDGTNVTYAKWCTTNIAYNNSNIKGDDLPSGITETYQIEEYSGFYIGRYEASQPSSGTVPQTQYNKLPWTNINYENSKNYAESYKNSENLKSGLLTGTMWDTVLAWIDKNVTGYSISKDKGNYSGTTPKNTAATASDCVNNIYDLAGNVREWTGEQISSYRMFRGGDCFYSYPASYRTYVKSVSNTNSERRI